MMISRIILIPVVLILFLYGCAAISTSVGVREPKISKIQPNDERSQVETLLGKRLWRLGCTDGLTYDIYQYDVERPASPAKGTMFLALDLLSFGGPELIYAEAEGYQPVKQIAIGYDDKDRVRFVSQAWLVETLGPCRRMRSVLPVASGVPSTARPCPMVSPVSSTPDVAILELDKEVQVKLDSRILQGDIVELPPGHHTISGYFDNFELFPGRLYKMKQDRFRRDRQFSDVFWIEDIDSGESVGCAWPSSLLGIDYNYLSP